MPLNKLEAAKVFEVTKRMHQLHYKDGMPLRTIGSMYDITGQAVYIRLKRYESKLKKTLDKA